MFKRIAHFAFSPLDTKLALLSAALIVISVFLIYSAEPNRLEAHLFNLAVAIVVLRITAGIPAQWFIKVAVPIYIAGLGLLIAVALYGDIAKGARRWLDIGFRLQPSELMKIAMPMMLAWFYYQRNERITLKDHALAIILLMIPCWLIARQPDLGTSILVFASGAYVIFFAGLPARVILFGMLSMAAFSPFAWHMLNPFQQGRIMILLDPYQDPLGKGFHIIQSIIAIGSGGFWGKGWRNGTQSQLDFIPENHTDFILAVLAEEFGFFGILLLVLICLLLLFRIFSIAHAAPTSFSRLIAIAIGMSFFSYMFVNIGMISGLLPVVGVPFPFVSYGGSALVSQAIGLGIIMSIAKRKQLVQS